MDAEARFKALPEHMKTRRWIESEIRHEKAEGVHTYHQCDCGRRLCRATMCWECWGEVLEHGR